MKVVLMELRVALGIAAMNVCSAVEAFGKVPNTTPPIRHGFADSLMVS